MRTDPRECACCASLRRFEPCWSWELRLLKFFIIIMYSRVIYKYEKNRIAAALHLRQSKMVDSTSAAAHEFPSHCEQLNWSILVLRNRYDCQWSSKPAFYRRISSSKKCTMESTNPKEGSTCHPFDFCRSIEQKIILSARKHHRSLGKNNNYLSAEYQQIVFFSLSLFVCFLFSLRFLFLIVSFLCFL